MPPRDATSSKTALVLQGGGARGAYHVGALKAVAEITGARRSPFQIVCGASVGAINAASIAYAAADFQTGTRQVDALWRSLHSGAVYDTRALPLLATSLKWASTLIFGHFGLRASGGLLDSMPLFNLLKQELTHKHLAYAIRSGALHALCITASSYSEGRAVTFFEGHKSIKPWSRARRRSERVRIGPEHLMASSALPFAFAPVLLGNGYFGDGALRSTSPLSPAIRTGADRILVIATRDDIPPALPGPLRQPPPSVGEMAGHALDIMFNDNLEADHERLVRVNQTLSLLTPAARRKTPLREIETVLLTPSSDVRSIAKQHVASLPLAIRLLLRSMGGSGGDGRMESYLMFEEPYIAALIDLGYTDTMARRDEVATFLAC